MSPQLQAWQAAGRHFDYRGQPIFVRREGHGEALLLIHGFPTASWDWHQQWPALAARFDVLTADMIGFGFSAKPRDYPYSIGDQADLFESLMAAEGIERCHVLAHDYGDTVAQELLARHLEGGPLRLESLCLLNGGLFPETHHARLVQKLLHTPLGPLLSKFLGRKAFARSFSAVFGPDTRPTAQELDDFWALITHNDGQRLFHRLIRYMAERRQHRERWVGALQNADIPIRLIDGPEDPVSGAHMVARYQELIPRPDVVSLPGIGHYPQCEAPEAVLAACLDFLARPA